MIAKVCDREIRRDSWFENRLVMKKFTSNKCPSSKKKKKKKGKGKKRSLHQECILENIVCTGNIMGLH